MKTSNALRPVLLRSLLIGLAGPSLLSSLARGQDGGPPPAPEEAQTVYDVLAQRLEPVRKECVATYRLRDKKTVLPIDGYTTQTVLSQRTAKLLYENSDLASIFSFVFTSSSQDVPPSVEEFRKQSGALRGRRQLDRYLPASALVAVDDPIEQMSGDYSCKVSLSSEAALKGGWPFGSGSLSIEHDLSAKGTLEDDKGLVWLGGRFHSKFEFDASDRNLGYAVWLWSKANPDLVKNDPMLWMLSDADLIAVNLYSKRWKSLTGTGHLEIGAAVVGASTTTSAEMERKFRSDTSNWALYQVGSNGSEVATTLAEFAPVGKPSALVENLTRGYAPVAYNTADQNDRFLTEVSPARKILFLPDMPSAICDRDLWVNDLTSAAAAGPLPGAASSQSSPSAPRLQIDSVETIAEPGASTSTGERRVGCGFTLSLRVEDQQTYDAFWANSHNGSKTVEAEIVSKSGLSFNGNADPLLLRIPVSVVVLKKEDPQVNVRVVAPGGTPLVSDGVSTYLQWTAAFGIQTSAGTDYALSDLEVKNKQGGAESASLVCGDKQTAVPAHLESVGAKDFRLVARQDLPAGSERRGGGADDRTSCELVSELGIHTLTKRSAIVVNREIRVPVFVPETYVPVEGASPGTAGSRAGSP